MVHHTDPLVAEESSGLMDESLTRLKGFIFFMVNLPG
jgi:hypothetical protein